MFPLEFHESLSTTHPESKGHLHGLLGVLVQGGALRLENGHVGLEQVLPLHPFLTWHGAHQDGGVDVLEAHLHLVSGDHLCGGALIHNQHDQSDINQMYLSAIKHAFFTF